MILGFRTRETSLQEIEKIIEKVMPRALELLRAELKKLLVEKLKQKMGEPEFKDLSAPHKAFRLSKIVGGYNKALLVGAKELRQEIKYFLFENRKMPPKQLETLLLRKLPEIVKKVVVYLEGEYM